MINLIKTLFSAYEISTEAQTLVNEFEAQDFRSYLFDFKNFSAAEKYQNAPSSVKREVIVGIVVWLDKPSTLSREETNWQKRLKMQEVLSHMLRTKLDFSEQEVLYLLKWSASTNRQHIHYRKIPQIIKLVENYQKENQLSEAVQNAILDLIKTVKSERLTTDTRKWSIKLNELIGVTETGLPLVAGDIWADTAIVQIKTLDINNQIAWSELLVHCLNASGSTPSVKWLVIGKKLIEAIGEENFNASLLTWLPLADHPRQHQINQYDSLQNFLEVNGNILKGLVWLASHLSSSEIVEALEKLAVSCYKKIPGIGPRAAKIGNASFWSLGHIIHPQAIAKLSLLKTKIKITSAQKVIVSVLEASAKRIGVSAHEIEEISVPTYSFQNVGLREDVFDGFKSEIKISNSEVEQTWHNKDGKVIATLPKAVKQIFLTEIKELSQVIKDVRKMITVQRERIDNLYLAQQKWNFEHWQTYYLNHFITGTLARRIIWKFSKDDKSASAIWFNNQFVDRFNKPIDWIDRSTSVELWHPIEVETNVVLEWRTCLLENEVQQPFKQAYREVYLLTDAERNTSVYSNRYAAHVLRQHQFNSLCAIRGWKNSLRLMVDDTFPPARKELPKWNLRAEYWVDGIGDNYGGDTNNVGTFLYLTTDQVRFYVLDANENRSHAFGGGYSARRWNGNRNAEPLALEEIPLLVLSEIMRDVDMFVGVASIGNDPNWLDNGSEVRYRDYWHGYSFGDLTESAKTRKQVLEHLIPRLKIAKRCSLSDKFLTVQGDIRTYKIHLGSGNILMEPNDQYLCIVPSRSTDAKDKKDKLFIPFEGDQTLSIILSKAFLLADDKSIKDPTITRQINL